MKDDFMKKVVIMLLIFLFLFTCVILLLFYLTNGMEPSVLIGCVFGACVGELSILGVLKKHKNKKEGENDNDN